MRRGAWIAVGLLVLVTLVALTAGRCGAGPPGPGAEARAPVVAPAATPQPAVVQAERTAAAGAATPAPADADAWSQRDDLDAFVRDEPDGTLGVVVLRGRHAVANARLRVWAEAANVGNAAETAATTPWAEAATDRDGRAQFPGAAAGDYVVRADDGGEHLIAGIATRHQSNRTLVLVYGTGTVTGRVCDAAGVAVVGGTVRLKGLGPISHASITSSTDRDGSFAFAGVAAGRMYVIAPASDERLGEERTISLAAGEGAHILFGRAGPLANWRGRLLDAEGSVVPGRRVLTVRDGATKDERRLLIAADGSFAIDLPPGAWEVHGEGGLFLGQWLSMVELPEQGLQRDLTYSGHRLVFTIGSCGRLHDAAAVAQQLWLRGPGVSTAAEGPFAAPAGEYVQWLVQQPGSYQLEAGNATLVGGVQGRLAVEVAATARVHRQTLFLQ